ncbi:MAG: CBS domain-containing protein [Arachnia sp.]
MRLEEVIRRKGSDVATITSDATIADLLVVLRTRKIGAVVVSDDGTHVDGIISERDVVMGLADVGPELLTDSVGHRMTREIYSALPEDEIEEVARTMTDHRIRHVPIVVEGELKAIVSIGDIVKYRIDQLTDERDQLLGYVQQ